jgi:hypothetical protein
MPETTAWNVVRYLKEDIDLVQAAALVPVDT